MLFKSKHMSFGFMWFLPAQVREAFEGNNLIKGWEPIYFMRGIVLSEKPMSCFWFVVSGLDLESKNLQLKPTKIYIFFV